MKRLLWLLLAVLVAMPFALAQTHSGGGGGSGGGSGTVTSATVVGTTNQITVTGVGSCASTTVLNCKLSLPNGVDLGTDNSAAGTLQLSNGSANAHTIFGSAATTSNTILGFATAPTTGHLVGCTVSSTTCTLVDAGAPGAATDLSNLAPTAINQSLLFDTDNAYDIGSASKALRNLYIKGSINFTGAGLLSFSGTPGSCGTASAGLGQLCLSSTGNRFVYSYDTGANANLVLSTDTIAIAHGGTGQTTANAAFNALSPNTTEGDITYYHSSANARLGVCGATQFYGSNGTDPACNYVSNLYDSNGNLGVSTVATASSVDYLSVTNAATANPAYATVSAVGTDSNIGISLQPKGAGVVLMPSLSVSQSTATSNTALQFIVGTGSTKAEIYQAGYGLQIIENGNSPIILKSYSNAGSNLQLGGAGVCINATQSATSCTPSAALVDLQSTTRIAAHVIFHTTAPTVSGTGCSLAAGNDVAGYVTVTGADTCTVTFSAAYSAGILANLTGTTGVSPVPSAVGGITTAITVATLASGSFSYYMVDTN